MNVQAINTYNNQPSFKQKEMTYKQAFTYVVRNSPGDRAVLTKKIGADNVGKLGGIAGFIKVGNHLKIDTYAITKDGKEYYKETFGVIPYYWHRVTGRLCRSFTNKR